MNGWESRAEAQYGIVTRAQLRESLSDRQIHILVQRGTLERVYAGVFRVGGSYRSARQRASAAVLACHPDGLLSHHTAAGLFRLPVRATGVLHVTVPRAMKRRLDGVCLHRTTVLGKSDKYVVDGLACTAPVRTIVDLSASCDGEILEHVFDSARRLGLVTAPVFRRRAEPLLVSGRPGAAQLRDLLKVIEQRPKESRLEVRAARLLRDSGIVPDTTQHRIGPYRIDFVLSLRSRRGLECDGFDWHGNRLAWKRDRRRIAWLEAQGWQLMHITWDDVTDRRAETLERIRARRAA